MMHLRRTCPSILAREEGLAFLEFALCLSILMLLFLGSIEVTRYALIVQKLEKIVETVADVTTQASPNSSPLTTTQMSQLLSAVPDMMNPYTFNSNGLVIVTDITQAGSSNPVVNWQYCGGGTLSHASNIGYVGMSGYATLPSGYTMIAGEEVVISEVFYNFTPLTTTKWSVVGATTLYRTSIFSPRLGALTAFSSHC